MVAALLQLEDRGAVLCAVVYEVAFRGSEGGYVQRHQIIDPHRLGRIKRLAVLHANERAVVRRLMPDDVVERLAVRESLARLRRAVELRRVRLDREQLLLELCRDVDDECRLHRFFAIGERVEELEGAEAREVGLDLRESGEKAGVRHELRAHAMIGMLAGDRRREHDAWLKLADEAHELRARGGRIGDACVGEPEIHARADAEQLGGAAGLLRAQLCGTARAHLALGEIDDRGALPERGRLEEGASARQLDIVAMRRDCQNVNGRHGGEYTPLTAAMADTTFESCARRRRGARWGRSGPTVTPAASWKRAGSAGTSRSWGAGRRCSWCTG